MQSLKLSQLNRALLAEFIAMTLFVFVGCGTAVSAQAWQKNGNEGNSFLVVVSLAFGLGISVLAYTIAPISGGHINPAVTMAFVLLQKMPILDGFLYMVVQFVGAIFGAALLWGCSDSDLYKEGKTTPFSLGANGVSSQVSFGSGFLIEAIGTFLLVWTVMMTAVHKKSIAGNIAPVAIGWSVFLAHSVLIPFTGCGINPARSAGPHVINAFTGAESPSGWWVFYTAPFVGSAFAAISTVLLMGLDDEDGKDNDAEEGGAKEEVAKEEGAKVVTE